MNGASKWLYLRAGAELKARGWSARELGRRAGIAPSTFTRLRDGHSCTLEAAASIADVLGMPLGDLIAPADCGTCGDAPPAGFSCQSCGAKGEALCP